MCRRVPLLFLLATRLSAQAQYEEDHILPSPCFGAAFIDPQGRLVNQRRADGPPWPWIGPQYLGPGHRTPVISDTTEYWFGDYGDGEPIGIWLHHLTDGRFSQGPVVCSDRYTFTDTEGEEHTGCHRHFIKDGVWRYYDRDSVLLRTERYARAFIYRKCGIDSSFFVHPTGREIPIFYSWRKSTHRSGSFFHHRTRRWDDEGRPHMDSEWDHWRHRSTEYYANGRVKRTWRATVLFGFRFNRAVTTEWSADGTSKVRTVGKAWESVRRGQRIC